MLRLTKKADYGLMSLKFLAERPELASHSAKDIADAYGIPPQLLAKILQRLAKVGLLRSHAGINGGYSLSRPPAQITAFEVIRAIDGPLFITSCDNGLRQCIADLCESEEALQRHSARHSGFGTTLVTLGRKTRPEAAGSRVS
jgi:Rrf2 family protein